jgi:hypothetical protein
LEEQIVELVEKHGGEATFNDTELLEYLGLNEQDKGELIELLTSMELNGVVEDFYRESEDEGEIIILL